MYDYVNSACSQSGLIERVPKVGVVKLFHVLNSANNGRSLAEAESKDMVACIKTPETKTIFISFWEMGKFTKFFNS